MATIWHLKKGSEKKFRFGHPWVFSNELAQSPKGVRPGELIELRDFTGAFLAHGYGHPNSLICFRTLSRSEKTGIDVPFFHERLTEAARVRRLAAVADESHRLCFAEGDHLPGLIVDRFILEDAGGPAQAFVIQSSTAGMDMQLESVFAALEKLVNEDEASGARIPWTRTALILANDSKSRVMEGLALEPKKVVRGFSGFDAENVRLRIQAGLPENSPLAMSADLINGQKTGFFLDQRANIQIASRFAKELVRLKNEIRVLDLCCYVGQWGAQLASLARQSGGIARVTQVDASMRALEIAARNVEENGGSAEPLKLDVLGGGLDRLEPGAFDIVICDPPAFIKKKKDLPTGTQAYYKMNREAIRKTARQGLYVSCSCSGLFTEEEFRGMLARVGQASAVPVRWLARGGHSPDHPQRPEFPQGTYLKSWIGVTL